MRCLSLLTILLLAVAACSGGQSSPGTGSSAQRGDSGSTAPTGMAAHQVASPAIRSATAEEILATTRSGSKVVLVNVWASWCGPCRAEFPHLVRLYRDYRGRGLELVLVSADFEDQLGDARAFLKKTGVDFPSYYKVGDDMQFINSLNPKWTGAIPATFIYDSEGRQRFFQEGQGTYKEFEKEVLAVLKSQAGSS